VDVAQDVRKNEGSLAEIKFIAEVYKVQTLVDGGVRVTLDLPETAIPQMAMLAECQRDGIPLVFVATVEEEKDLNRPKANRL
jgi:hypothetical protein